MGGSGLAQLTRLETTSAIGSDGTGATRPADPDRVRTGRAALDVRVYATVVTPKQLTTFHLCPLQHHLRFRRKVRGAIPPNTPPLAEGNALHQVMRRWFRRDRDRRAATDPAIVDGWLDEALTDEPYRAIRAEDPDARDRALHRLSGQAGWCLAQIPDDVHVRAAEREFQTGPLRLGRAGMDDRSPVRFRARLDLLVEHPDGGIEHIDFKTGGQRATHWIQHGVERLVVGDRHPVVSGGPPTRTTMLYTGHRQVESICHTPDSFRSLRSDLRDLTRRMLTTPTSPTGPEPTHGGHCAWCPYRETACSAHRRQGRVPGVRYGTGQ
ncbi:MAG TPA: PD-(D/E)XK nuclease family protein [Thermomicrobiales bacterium]|jgi:CRISPR/Cas system-associated exonuclease Cas4 (RecB family)|nr:PD-(D/E)XK nuclease family protein [Thermomicrobiales bacterium]